jgi:glutamine amidotransferase
MNVVILDLGVSNVQSLASALEFLGASYTVSSRGEDILGASHLILPGVGAFDAAMASIERQNIRGSIEHAVSVNRVPVLGVCLGMQILFESSEEGELPGLGLVKGGLKRLGHDLEQRFKVPHVGFAQTSGFDRTGLFADLDEPACFYFTHSYAVPASTATGNHAICRHAWNFVAAFQKDNICGAQFHPEKSQSAGLRVLSNFMKLMA